MNEMDRLDTPALAISEEASVTKVEGWAAPEGQEGD